MLRNPFAKRLVSIEPSEGSFDNPSAWQQLKAGRVGGAFDDLDGPVAEFGEGVTQVGAVIDAVKRTDGATRETAGWPR